MTDAPVPLTRPTVGAAELHAVARVLESGWLAGQGPEGERLEEAFSTLTGRAHAMAVSNCTAGLHLALRALGVGPGDEVLVADYSFPATAHAVLHTGARPVFVDVLATTGTLDPAAVAAAVTPRTRVLVVVDSLGMPADWAELTGLARDHGLALLADCACSAGATYDGRPTGAFGDVAAFSLHARKGVTSGEGGVVVTDDPDFARRVRAESAFGILGPRSRPPGEPAPGFESEGFNYKLADVLAAIGVVQVGRIAELTARRRSAARVYADLLADLAGVTVPVEPDGRTSSWQAYAVLLDDHLDRDAVISGLRDRGIGSTIGTYAQHLQPVFGGTPGSCPVSARLARQHLALPMFADLAPDTQARVATALTEVVAGLS